MAPTLASPYPPYIVITIAAIIVIALTTMSAIVTVSHSSFLYWRERKKHFPCVWFTYCTCMYTNGPLEPMLEWGSACNASYWICQASPKTPCYIYPNALQWSNRTNAMQCNGMRGWEMACVRHIGGCWQQILDTDRKWQDGNIRTSEHGGTQDQNNDKQWPNQIYLIISTPSNN